MSMRMAVLKDLNDQLVVRDHNGLLQHSELPTVDKDTLAQVEQFLNHRDNGLRHLHDILSEDLRDVNTIRREINAAAKQ